MVTIRDIVEETLRKAKDTQRAEMSKEEREMTFQTLPTDDVRAQSHFLAEGGGEFTPAITKWEWYALAYVQGRYPDSVLEALLQLMPQANEDETVRDIENRNGAKGTTQH